MRQGTESGHASWQPEGWKKCWQAAQGWEPQMGHNPARTSRWYPEWPAWTPLGFRARPLSPDSALGKWPVGWSHWLGHVGLTEGCKPTVTSCSGMFWEFHRKGHATYGGFPDLHANMFFTPGKTSKRLSRWRTYRASRWTQGTCAGRGR